MKIQPEVIKEVITGILIFATLIGWAFVALSY